MTGLQDHVSPDLPGRIHSHGMGIRRALYPDSIFGDSQDECSGHRTPSALESHQSSGSMHRLRVRVTGPLPGAYQGSPDAVLFSYSFGR